MKWIFAIITVVFSFSATQAFADTFRCPNGNLVSTGDKISTVAAKCDPAASTVRREEPMQVDVTNADNTTGTKTIYIEVQEWSYTQGSSLLHTLIFRNGVLSEVNTSGFVQ